LGQQDGVAYQIGVTAPTVDEHVTLENPNSVIFRDPVTRKPFNAFAQEVTAVASSSNLTKLSYLTPRLFGAQIGLSYTPTPVKSPLPLTGNPSNLPNVQAHIWEAVAAYQTRIEDVAVGVSAGYSRGALRNPTPGHSDLHDFAAGIQLAYDIGQVRLAGGAAYRVSNGYGFDPGSALDDRELTQRLHVSAMVTYGGWRAGGEYAFSDLDGLGVLPDLDFDAYQLAAGYRFNDALQISAGWQWYDYARGSGVFSNGAPAVDMNGGFISIGYAIR
jgi:predicted porin